LFDGGLPTRKRATRAARYQSLLEDYLQQAQRNTNKHPPPPFVVLVCQQTLLRLSRTYGFNVRVVPGEADDYCVRLAREADNVLIVSADGDFLVYAGEDTSFVPLQTFPSCTEETITFTVFSRLREGLGLNRANGLVEVAALLREEVPLSVQQCICCVNERQTQEHMPRETLHDYVEEYVAGDKLDIKDEMRAVLDSAVPSGRLTELFFSPEIPTFWLPLIPTSNPPRRTPWAISRFIRKSAYKELRRRGFISGDTVVEMVQRGQRIAEENVPIEDVMEHIDPDSELIFITAITILFENVSDDEFQYLEYFVGMFILLQQQLSSSTSANIHPALQYIIYQYQTIVYSLLILLQCRFPTSTSIPEFVTFWDLPHFTMAMTHETDEGKALSDTIVGQLEPSLKARYNSQTSSSHYHTKKVKKQRSAKGTAQQTRDDPTNRFSALAA
jgi:XPG domain containing